jgi:SAM-dependent methyltransferase
MPGRGSGRERDEWAVPGDGLGAGDRLAGADAARRPGVGIERAGGPQPRLACTGVTSEYWRSALDDEAMQDEHGFIWQAMLETIDMDLNGLRVLDAGCNRGGFLRLLVDTRGIAAGWGYDPASGAVADARRLAGERPLTFETASSVPAGWRGFDVAFSHEVLYLIGDLAAHAQAMFAALDPGRPYFAVIGAHAQSQLMGAWRATHADDLGLPPLRDLDELVDVFELAGFDAYVARLRLRFVPVSAHRARHGDRGQLMDWLDYYSHDKLLFRFTRPPDPSPTG